MSSNSINIIRGDDVSITIKFTDSDGNPIDLTGATVYFTAKNNLSDADNDAVLSADITSHSNPTNGETVLTFADTDTDGLTVKSYYYDLQLKTAAGKISSVKAGKLNILEDVTRRIA